MAYLTETTVLGKPLSRAYILERLKKGYLIKDIVREWAKDNNINIFGGKRHVVPVEREKIQKAVNRFIYGYQRSPHTLVTGEKKVYASRPPDKELVDLITKTKKNIAPATVLKQFNKFISDNKAKYVGKKGGTENLYADAVKWFKKNNPAAITIYGEAGFAGKGVKLRPGQEVIMVEGRTVSALQKGRESIRKLVAPSKQIKNPLRYVRTKEAWTKAAESLGMTYNEYQNMLRKNMTYPLKTLFPQLIGTQYAAGPEHMYGLRQAIATGQLSEIRKAAKAVVPAPKAFNSLIKGPRLDLQVTGLLDNAFNTNDLAKRKDIIKTVNRKIAEFKSQYPGTYPKYVIDKVGNIKDVNIKDIAMTKRPLPVQAKEYIDYLIKTPGFKESKEFASLPETSQALIQSRTEKAPQFYNQLVKSINSVPALKSMMEKRVGCAEGCLAAVAKNEPTKFGKAIETLPQKARGFLSLLGRGGVKAAPLAAVAALGAVAEPLVKQFRNDDYSTYLSDPEQQGSMLLSMVEAETPKVDQEVLKWQYPGMAAGAASAIPGSSAMMKARKAKGFGLPRQALGPVGKFLAGTFSPLGLAATLPISVAAQVKGGSDVEDIATDPFNWLGPAFASTGARMATRGMAPTGILAKAIRMGMSPATLRAGSRFLGMPGLALSAGLTGYDWWKNRGKDNDDEFKVRTYKDDDD